MKIKQRAKRILLDITANVAHHKNKRGKTLSAYNERNYNEIHKSQIAIAHPDGIPLEKKRNGEKMMQKHFKYTKKLS